MKPPTQRIASFAPWRFRLAQYVNEFEMSMEDAIGQILSSAFSSSNTVQEAIAEEFGIPPLKYLVNESILFRDNEGVSGRFIIKAISGPMLLSSNNFLKKNDSNRWMFVGVGYIETKKFFGLFNKSECVTCNLSNGDYSVYPKELIEYAINASDGIKEAGNETIARLIEKESTEADEKLKIRRMREEKIEDNLVKAFNKQPVLDFNSTSIDDTMAGILARYNGHLKLNAITSLSYSAAKLLARQEGELELNGLIDVSDQVAESLADHEGHLYVRSSILEKISKYK